MHKDREPGTTVSSRYTGTVAMFRAAGFREVARRHPQRPLMRLDLP